MNKRLSALFLASMAMLSVGVYAQVIATLHTTGHIRIVNSGATPGITVNPTLLDFGNVTIGSSATLPINVTNTGNCIEVVQLNGTAFNTSFPNLIVPPLKLNPGQTVTVTASYNSTMTQNMGIGDYTFDLYWSATCL